jgi:hypothetical protein
MGVCKTGFLKTRHAKEHSKHFPVMCLVIIHVKSIFSIGSPKSRGVPCNESGKSRIKSESGNAGPDSAMFQARFNFNNLYQFFHWYLLARKVNHGRAAKLGLQFAQQSSQNAAVFFYFYAPFFLISY